MKEIVTLVVGVIAALVAVSGYLFNNAASRRAERAKRYADALDAVEQYRDLPYAFLRLHDESEETRAELAKLLNATQRNLTFHRRWMSLESPAVATVYETLVAKVRIQGGDFRRQALTTPPPAADVEIEVG